MMRVTGESVSVTKRCVPLEDCLSTGCTYVKHEEYKVRTGVASLCETRQGCALSMAAGTHQTALVPS